VCRILPARHTEKEKTEKIIDLDTRTPRKKNELEEKIEDGVEGDYH
jgi:hypothetical protein